MILFSKIEENKIESEKNKLMEDSTIYNELESQVKASKSMMAQASDTIMNQDVSSYPIFVLHRDGVELGIPLKEATNLKEDWHINASTLEEFVAKQIVNNDKVENFKSVYKSPDQFLCLFVVDKSGATFVFLPRS